MLPSEVVFNDKITNRDKFGVYLRARRHELGLSSRSFADELNLSAAYISDVEKGNRYAPLEHLEQIVRVLQIEEGEIEYFYDLAGCTHKNWPDINEYLAKTPNARKAIRLARDRNVSEKDFLNIVENLRQNNLIYQEEIEK